MVRPSGKGRERLKWEVESILDDGIRMFVHAVLEDVSDRLEKTPAALKFHSEMEREPGGLVLHIQRVVEVAREMCRERGLGETETDKVVAAAILHDLGKIDVYLTLFGISDRNEEVKKRSKALLSLHPMLSVWHIRKWRGLAGDHYEDIRRIVECHMGHWNRQTYFPERMDELAWILCYADHIATKFAERLDIADRFRDGV